jgi:hypothetical protein
MLKVLTEKGDSEEKELRTHHRKNKKMPLVLP